VSASAVWSKHSIAPVARARTWAPSSRVIGSGTFFSPLVGGTVQLLPPGQVYAGGVSRPLVLVELKLPDIGLADPAARAAFIAAATGIVRALARPGHRDEDTWINILNARDGAGGVGGRVLTNDDLVAAIMAAAGAPA
jgi:hypothetical protein